MCGIAGFADFKNNYDKNKNLNINKILNMTKSIEKRGPDSFGYEIFNYCVLGHRRLSIIDIEGGIQPITTSCGKFTIVYNGEIYNTKELKTDLINLGATFNTNTDTEVVLNVYKYFKEEGFKKLNGIFAFAIWDEIREQLVLCRDHLGVKPLFYTIVDGELIFGSEIKALREHDKVNLEIDDNGLQEILGLFPSREEGNGVFKNINEVKYGHYVIFKNNSLKEYPFWELKSEENHNTYEENVDVVKYLVTDSIKRQMRSDVPISTFLSGGLDSSIITGVIAKEFEKSNKVLDTYSFDYEENSVYFKSNAFQVDEDKKWVVKMRDEFNTNHKFLECSIDWLKKYLYNAVDAKDFVGMADIDSSLLYFCEQVSKNHKVVLSGECADEIFGGYPWFHSEEAFKTNNFPWIRNIELREGLLNEDLRKKLNLKDYITSKYEKSISNVPKLSGENKEEARRREISYLNIKWFMTTLLERMDRMSMYSGLESRVPYADYRIVDFMWNVPWEHKSHGQEKGILRDAFKELLPKDLLYRKKCPYPKTYNPKYELMLGDILKEIINNNNSPILNIIDKKEITKLINSSKDYGKPWFGQLMAGPQLVAYYIQLNYWLDKYNIKI